MKVSWMRNHPEAILQNCVDEELKNGIILYGEFFIDPESFYQYLRNMDEAERKQFEITGVAIVISGERGQYDFASMAQALPCARLIMMIKATKRTHGGTVSNIFLNQLL